MSGVSSEPGKMWFNGWVWNSGSHSVTRLQLAAALRGRQREGGNDGFCHAMGVQAHFLTNCIALKFRGLGGILRLWLSRCTLCCETVLSAFYIWSLSLFFFFFPPWKNLCRFYSATLIFNLDNNWLWIWLGWSCPLLRGILTKIRWPAGAKHDTTADRAVVCEKKTKKTLQAWKW